MREPRPLKPRGGKPLPIEKLYEILHGIYTEKVADEAFEYLTGVKMEEKDDQP